MQKYAYLIALVISLGGLLYLDNRFKLAWFWDKRRTFKILAFCLLFFLIWDVLLINSGVVYTNQAWVSGLYILTPNMPIEELFFLTLFGYQTLLLWRWQCTRS